MNILFSISYIFPVDIPRLVATVQTSMNVIKTFMNVPVMPTASTLMVTTHVPVWRDSAAVGSPVLILMSVRWRNITVMSRQTAQTNLEASPVNAKQDGVGVEWTALELDLNFGQKLISLFRVIPNISQVGDGKIYKTIAHFPHKLG